MRYSYDSLRETTRLHIGAAQASYRLSLPIKADIYQMLLDLPESMPDDRDVVTLLQMAIQQALQVWTMPAPEEGEREQTGASEEASPWG